VQVNARQFEESVMAATALHKRHWFCDVVPMHRTTFSQQLWHWCRPVAVIRLLCNCIN